MGCAAIIGEYPAGAPPLGISPESQFPNHTFNLQGGCLYLYTDGLLEARIGDRRLEKEGLLCLLKEYAHLPLEARIDAISNAVKAVDGIVDDDLTLLIIEEAR